MKKVIVLVGLPGSGKSSYTQQLLEDLDGQFSAQVHSTDTYFMVKGQYMFDAKRLGYHHRLNLDAFKVSVDAGINLIIVDNTNIKSRDRKPYIDYAFDNDYEVSLQVVGEFTEEFAKVCAERNTHGVPLEVILRMARQIQLPKEN
jgi:predicted kinase